MARDVDISIGADSSPAAAGFADLRNIAARARREMEGEFRNPLQLVGISVSIGAAITAIKSLVSYGDHVYELGQRFAVSTTAIQQFGNVAERSGSSLQGVALAFNRLDIATSKALGGNQQILESFANLGITIADIQTLTPEEIMLKIGTSSLNAADMVAILGRSGTELRETLRKLAEGTEELSGAIDPKHIQALHEADENWKRWGETVWVFSSTIIAGWMDGMDHLFGGMSESEEKIAALRKQIESLALIKITADTSELPAIDIKLQKLSASIAQLEGKSRAGGTGGSPVTEAEDTAEALRRSGGASSESLQQRLAKLEEENAAKQRSNQEQLATLLQKRVALTHEMLVAIGEIGGVEADETTQLQSQIALAENTRQIYAVQANIAKDEVELQKKIVNEREKAANQADAALSRSREANRELQLELQGREDLAKRAKIEFEFDEKIKDAQGAIETAEKQGFTQVAATNRELVVQLSLEKQTALAAHDKAEAEKQAAAAVRDAELAVREASEVETAKEDLAVLRERRVEQQLIHAGLIENAEELRNNFDWDLKINRVTADLNEAWNNMNKAYRDGNTLLGDQYAQLAKILAATRAELETERQISQEMRAQKTWREGLQTFVNNAATHSPEDLTASSVTFRNYVDARNQFLQQQQSALRGPFAGRGQPGDVSQWAGLNAAFEQILTSLLPHRALMSPSQLGGGHDTATIESLRRQIELLQEQLDQLMQINKNLTPFPGTLS